MTDDDNDLFQFDTDDSVDDLEPPSSEDFWKVLLVDDDKEVHSITKLVLENFRFKNKALDIMSAYSGEDAVELIKQHPDTALILLDIVMETEHAGLDVVKRVRNEVRNSLVRIVLRTGQPGQAPESEVIEKYDINDYKDKTELRAEKLITLMYSALRSYSDILEIKATKQALAEQYEKTLSDLRESKRHVFNVIDSMPSILVGINKDYIITDWNSCAEKFTKIDAAHALCANLFQVMPLAKHFKKLIEKTFVSNTEQNMHRMALPVANEQHYFDISIYPIAVQKYTGAVIRIDDITENILHDKMLVESEKMVMIGGIASSLADELQNPLSVIIQNSQNIINRIDPKAKKNNEIAEKHDVDLQNMSNYLEERNVVKFVTNMRDAADQALNLIVNLVSFGINDDVEVNYLPIKNIFIECLDLLKRDVEIKQLLKNTSESFLHQEIPDDIPDIPCIKAQLIQAFFNVFRYLLVQEQEDDSITQVNLSVEAQDTVLSIKIHAPDKYIKDKSKNQSFQNYFIKEQQKDDHDSLGLVSLHYIITEMHKGNIRLSSSKDNGTLFNISLPIEVK